jgi:hypothetical protein
MDTSNQKQFGLIVFCLSILLFGYFFGISLKVTSINSKNETENVLDISSYIHTSDSSQILIDKVFTFLAPNDSLIFDDLVLVEEFCYYLTVEIVTPHNCMINITIIDPEEFQYNIFNTEVNVSQDDGWFEVPFGTVMSGNYSVLMEVITVLNLNIHFQLQKEHKCLFDIIPPNLLGALKFYEVSRYTDGMELAHNVQLRTDYSYRCYIGRVSSIGGKPIKREISTFFTFTDPNSVEFQIYDNESLVAIGEVLQFDFGTAMSGIYSFNLAIENNVECVNIAYAIVEDFRLSDEINGTTPPHDPNNNGTTLRGIVIMPSEFIIGAVIICSCLTGITIIIIAYKQKKNAIHTNL